MKKKTLLLLWVAATLATLSACSLAGVEVITGSGTTTTQTYNFTGFDEIEIGSAFTVTVSQGNAYNVVVRVDDNLVDRLVVTQEENRIAIGLKDGTTVSRATLEADVTLPNLNRLNAHGAGRVQVNPFLMGDTFVVDASGAAEIRGDLDAVDLELEASGAGRVILTGTAANVQAHATGASIIDLSDLSAVDAQVDSSGGSTITVNIDGILDADADGGASVYYLGNPEMGTINVSGGSNVEQR